MSAPLLEVSDLNRYFGGLRAVNTMTFTLSEGEVVGLLGPNGSGKTTLLNLISGTLKPTSGSIRLAGREVGGLPPHRISAAGVARTFQLVRLLPTHDVLDNVVMGMAFTGPRRYGRAAREAAAAIVEKVGLKGHEHHLPDQLTYIDQKRVELARVMAAEARLVLLDEWLAGLNPTESAIGIELVRTLQQQGCTVLMVEHVMHAIRALCGRCVVMNAGALIVEDETQSALSHPEVVRAYLGDSDA